MNSSSWSCYLKYYESWLNPVLVALNDALKEEIQHLKILTGQAMPPNGGPMMNFASFGGGQQFYPNNHAMHTLLATSASASAAPTIKWLENERNFTYSMPQRQYFVRCKSFWSQGLLRVETAHCLLYLLRRFSFVLCPSVFSLCYIFSFLNSTNGPS